MMVKKLGKKEKKQSKKVIKTGLSIPVYDPIGKEIGSLQLPKKIFDVSVDPRVLAQYVSIYLANKRQGTASTKTRSEVRGSTKKIYRQKGTGRARHGDIKAPIFVGGGIVGGPKPKKYRLKMNKKHKRLALFGALSQKLKQNNIIGLDRQFLNIEAKTRKMVDFLASLRLIDKKILVVMPKMEKNNLLLAGRNLPNLDYIDVTSINAYQVLSHQKVFLLDESLKVLEKNFLKNEN